MSNHHHNENIKELQQKIDELQQLQQIGRTQLTTLTLSGHHAHSETVLFKNHDFELSEITAKKENK